MKIFVYKTLFVFICLFLFYKFTIDSKINEYEKKFELLQSDYGREIIREKIREEVRKSLKKDTILCVATNLSLKTEFINTETVQNWKKKDYDFNKKPSIFLIQSKS